MFSTIQNTLNTLHFTHSIVDSWCKTTTKGCIAASIGSGGCSGACDRVRIVQVPFQEPGHARSTHERLAYVRKVWQGTNCCVGGGGDLTFVSILGGSNGCSCEWRRICTTLLRLLAERRRSSNERQQRCKGQRRQRLGRRER